MVSYELLIENAILYQAGTLAKHHLLINDGIIQKVLASEQQNELQSYQFKKVIDAKEQLLTPPLIDCHTHLVYGGNRSHEFEWRLNGKTYQEIAQRGGGIRSTVEATRAATFDELYQAAKKRMLAMMAQGVLSFEIKSGYGLDLATEVRMLKVAKQLGKDLAVRVATTYLGAHTLPKEYENQPDSYIDYICQEVLPQIKTQNLACAVDVFCESIGFNLKQTEKVFDKAQSLGFNIKCHAEQISNLGASFLAASKGALSCDHLEYLDEKAVLQMKASGTVAVLLPGAFYFLKEKQLPPIELLRLHQVPMAVATDANPGSSPTNSLPLMMNMACVLFGLSVDEVWQAVTDNAARALGLVAPQLAAQQEASFVLWPFSKPVDLIYEFGQLATPRLFTKGVELNIEELSF